MTLIVGHRGARNLWPENGLAGFRNLLSLGVEAVEFDVHPTRAGELLVIHDATLDRTTERSGRVADLGALEHRSAVLKHGDGEVIPTLEEVLAVYRDSNMELHVELKADADGVPYEGLERRAAETIDAFGLAFRSFLTSFSLDVLATVRSVAPHIRRLASLHAKSVGEEGIRGTLERTLAVADVIAVEKALLLDQWELISAIVPSERLGVWVPNEEADLAFWLARPVRQITTDRPDLALKARAGLVHAAD